ncbi:MAG TPA: BTAD domain-containing putative transcriptional regulator [Candidatus Acidoferrales bacterium]|nr:BTAD domain-containing putative transcriptional regulator [Candidatus Acidoferrales bacterium]
MVVFDNYQEVSPDAALHEVIREALEQIPEGGHVLFISRSSLPPNLTRLRANRSITILDGNDLRLNLSEAEGLARSILGKPLPRTAIGQLHDAVHGWAAGMILMLERIKIERQTAPSLPRTLPQSVFDYFAWEIFQKSGGEIQHVLIHTAFLRRFSARMAERISQNPNAGAIIDRLSREHYFTYKHDAPEPVYQYHPLFGEFLLQQAERNLSADQRGRILRAAGAILAEEGNIEDAVQLLHQAKDWDKLAQLIQGYAPALVQQGRSKTLEEWLRWLPQSMLNREPWLLYWFGVCRMPSNFEEARQFFEQGFHIFRKEKNAPGVFLTWSSIVETFNWLLVDAKPLDTWISLLPELLNELPPLTSTEIKATVAKAMLGTLLIRQPQNPDITRWARRVARRLNAVSDFSLRTELTVLLALYHLWTGDVAEAASLAEPLRKIPEHQMSDVFRLLTLFCLGRSSWIRGDPEASVRIISDARTLADETGVHQFNNMLRGEGAVAALSMGDLRKAREFTGEMGRGVEKMSTNDLALYNYAKGWEALLDGKLEVASQYREATQRCATSLGAPFVEALASLFSAHVLHEQSDDRRSIGYLSRVLGFARSARARFIEYMALLLEAQIAFDQRQEEKAFKALRDAMRVGRDCGYFNTYTWRPDVMIRLCMKALEANIEPEYVKALIRKRALAPKSPPIEVEQWPWPIKIFTLGRFSVVKDGQPVQFSRKIQRKPFELLKAIIALGGRNVSESQLIEALWPDAEADVAHQSLATTLHRLRRLLGQDEAIQRQESKLSINARFCWVDLWAVERLLTRAEATASQMQKRSEVWSEVARLVEKAAAFYHGPFLHGEEFAWATNTSDRLRRRLLRHLRDLGEYFERDWKREKAAEWYEKALAIDPCAEEVYRRLITVYRHQGRRAEALAVYERCRKNLHTLMGISPAPETESLAKALRASQVETSEQPPRKEDTLH